MKKHLRSLLLFIAITLILTGCSADKDHNTTAFDLTDNAGETQTNTPDGNDGYGKDTTESEGPLDSTSPETQTDTSSATTAQITTAAPEATTSPETTTPPPSETQAPPPTAVCTHSTTKLTGVVDATCANEGYTGDVYCSDCNALISRGSIIQKTSHKNTSLINKKAATLSEDGYTGDTYCSDCKSTLQKGSVIAKTGVKITSATYGTLWVDKSIANSPAEIRRYTMQQKTQSVPHQYETIEKEILRLVNIERRKEGLGDLSWYEDAYCFTEVRAEECFTLFEHERPDGTAWYTVYQNAGVWLNNPASENLYKSEGQSVDYILSHGKTLEDIAQDMVSGWMNSPGHRAAILTPEFKEIAVAVMAQGDVIIGVQNFFG